ncbi:hypothetical protein VTJ49DRAFT_1462 [Mycothermus thermophilus]|uniref:Sm domain-containing protein n=1 Tax=Humicola insolens TaxID=85995 RepID=A0ABR3VCI3_HUMIN
MDASAITSSPTQRAKIKDESAAYLRSLLNKNLRVTTTDNRMFWGSFKCTDYESNIVLQHTYEYRFPMVTPESLAAAAEQQSQQSQQEEQKPPETATETETESQPNPSSTTATPPNQKKTVKLDMTSRYLGLVVVPGKHIVRIEVEEFASQMRGRQQQQRRVLAKPPASADGVGEEGGGGGGGGGCDVGVGVVV